MVIGLPSPVPDSPLLRLCSTGPQPLLADIQAMLPSLVLAVIGARTASLSCASARGVPAGCFPETAPVMVTVSVVADRSALIVHCVVVVDPAASVVSDEPPVRVAV